MVYQVLVLPNCPQYNTCVSCLVFGKQLDRLQCKKVIYFKEVKCLYHCKTKG